MPQQHCKQHSDSGQQVSSLPVIAKEVPVVRLPINYFFNKICHSGFVVDKNLIYNFSILTLQYLT